MPHRARNGFVGLLLSACLALAAGQAQGAEPLDRLLGFMAPQTPQSGFVFSYLRRTPDLAGDLTARAIFTDIHPVVMGALIDSAAATRLTGVEFGRVEAVLLNGDPTSGSLVLAGPAGFAAKAPATLLARGFKRGTDDVACAMKNPNDIDEDKPEIPIDDPFGRESGALYCLSLVGELAIVTRQVEPAAKVRQAAKETSCPICDLLQAMVAAERAARGGKGEVVSAMGFTLFAHAGAGDHGALLEELGKLTKDAKPGTFSELNPRPRPTPGPAFPHVLAVLSASRGHGTEVAQISLLYPESRMAVGATIVRDRLLAFQRGAERVNPRAVTITQHAAFGPMAIAVITLDYAPGSDRAALRELHSWIEATMQRRFDVLDPVR